MNECDYSTIMEATHSLTWTLVQPHAIKYSGNLQAVVEYDIDPDIDITARIAAIRVTCSRGYQYNIMQHHMDMLRTFVKRGGLPTETTRSEQIPQDGQHWFPGPLANGEPRTTNDPLVATMEITFTGLVKNPRIVIGQLPLPVYFIRPPLPVDSASHDPAAYIEPLYLQNKRKPVVYACIVGETLLPVIAGNVSNATYDMIVRNLNNGNGSALTPMHADTNYTQSADIAYLTIIGV